MKRKAIEKTRDEKSYNFIYFNFIRSLNHLKVLKKYILFSFALLIFGMIFGLLFPDIFKDQVLQVIKELLKQTENLGPFELIGFIIFNNIKTSFIGMIFGIFFALVPIGILAVNGYVLGFVINKTAIAEGFLTLWKLFPHGIFEIPAVIISIGIGIKLGISPFYMKDKKKGVFSFLVFFLLFLFLSSILSSLLFLISNPDVLRAEKINLKNGINPYSEILENPVTSFVFFIILFFCFIFSLFLCSKVMNQEDKKVLANNIKDSIRVFVFIVMPLLVIAGIIEGLLIWVLG